MPSHPPVNAPGPPPLCKIQTAHHIVGIKAPGFLLSDGGEGNTGNLLRSFTADLTAQSGALVRGRFALPSMPLSLPVRN